ncbi:hypothetical protein EJ05DRAFT_486610 [Pseudovirgaria hyperparasitica]|uniref:Uncharacterized protein n=1 Tax=Pseudovirgaria hyperparasitica TaxID=470096 RepID=A0A6A6W3Z3_9PEZI|nr:uncharacterized protein EJ05DRAFT_486610 [Pseudovirgaria hyperparasitica]KAF2757572.1 hypothetical protein EJ05DRAFT_486610 [Pseudovirgaria hyperparasitica]
MSESPLTQEEEQVLVEDQILIPLPYPHQSRTKKGKVFAAFFSSLSSPDSSSIPPSASGTISVFYQSTSPNIGIEIPLVLHSPETIEYLGFEIRIAHELFSRWNHRHPRIGLLDFVYGHTASARGLKLDSANISDRDVLAQLGVQTWLQDTTLDKVASQVVDIHIVQFWLDDTLKTRYNSLRSMLHLLKSHAVLRLHESAQI